MNRQCLAGGRRSGPVADLLHIGRPCDREGPRPPHVLEQGALGSLRGAISRAGDIGQSHLHGIGLPDIACAVYRASQRPYRALFENVWGLRAFAIAWQTDVEQVCDRPGPPASREALPVHLSPVDRGRVGTTFDQMAQSIAGYEASAEVTSFTSKFDAVLAKKAQFTTQEKAGYDLFRGKARCNECHRDGWPRA